MVLEHDADATNDAWAKRLLLIVELVEELISGRNEAVWERRRVAPATNRVYRAAVPGADGAFVIIKLLPGLQERLRTWTKVSLRNVMYGERDEPSLHKKVGLEAERVAEWRRQGLLVPRLLPVPYQGVRVFEGLPYPTLAEILGCGSAIDEQLDAVTLAVESLARQHQISTARGMPSLVHQEPHPGNLIVDAGTPAVYWTDLEQPSEFPGLSMNSLRARALRVFLYGVLYNRRGDEDLFVQRIVSAYAPAELLWDVARGIRHRRALPFRLALALGLRKEIYRRQLYLAGLLDAELRRQGVPVPAGAAD